MTKKITDNMSSTRRITGRFSRPSIFDKLIREVDIQEIPFMLVDQIYVQYMDGNSLSIPQEDLVSSIPLHRTLTKEAFEEVFNQIDTIQIFLNTDKLEEAVLNGVEEILGKYC